MNKSIIAAVLAAPLIMFQPAWAHTDEQLDTMSSPHGGQVRAAGPFHLELVVKDRELLLYVTDHAGQEIHTDGGEGKASIQHDKVGSKITVKLESSQNNVLKGSCDSQINPETVSDCGIRQATGAGCVRCPIYSAEAKVCRGGKEIG